MAGPSGSIVSPLPHGASRTYFKDSEMSLFCYACEYAFIVDNIDCSCTMKRSNPMLEIREHHQARVLEVVTFVAAVMALVSGVLVVIGWRGKSSSPMFNYVAGLFMMATAVANATRATFKMSQWQEPESEQFHLLFNSTGMVWIVTAIWFVFGSVQLAHLLPR